MLLNAYSIFDNKALVYAPPFYAANAAVAKRIVSDAASDPNSSLNRHPGDYVVYQVGNFNDANGQFTPVSPLVHICDVVSLMPMPATPLFDTQPSSEVPPTGRA